MTVFTRAHTSFPNLRASLRYLSHPDGVAILSVKDWSGGYAQVTFTEDLVAPRELKWTPEQLREALNVPERFKRLLVPDAGGFIETFSPFLKIEDGKAVAVRGHSLCVCLVRVRR